MRNLIAQVLAAYRRMEGDPPVDRLADALGPAIAGDPATLITIDAEARRLLGRPPDADRWFAALPLGPPRSAALDAIVLAVLEDEEDEDRFIESCRALAQRGADAAAAVARFRLVREVLREAIADESNASSPASAPATMPTAPCDFGPPLGDDAARFHLRRRLGAGSSGTAFEAIDRRYSDDAYEHRVVVKVLPGALAARAEDEIRRGSRVLHPGVVRWLDWGTAPGGFAFVVSELVPAESLAEPSVLRRLGRRGAIDVVRQVAEAVDATHSAGILHMDVKPANILVDATGTARLCDFGAAMPIHGALGGASVTPIFAAPEILDGAAPTPTADIYALGAVLRWCMDELDELDAAPLPADDARRIGMIWSHAMHADSAARYAIARALAQDLGAWLDHRPLSIEAPSLVDSVRLSFRRDPVTWSLAAAAVVAIALFAWSWIDGRITEANLRATRLLEEARRLRAQAEIGRYVDRLDLLAQSDGLSAAPQVLALQWLAGTSGIGVPELQSRAAGAQRSAWRSIVEAAQREGAMDRLEPRLAELSLAVTDLEASSFDLVQARCTVALPWWRARLAPQDPVLRTAESIAELAKLGLQTPRTPAEMSERRARLAEIGDSMRERAPRIARIAERMMLPEVQRRTP